MAIDYPAVLVDDLPKYLLAPEISALLHFMPDLRRGKPSNYQLPEGFAKDAIIKVIRERYSDFSSRDF